VRSPGASLTSRVRTFLAVTAVLAALAPTAPAAAPPLPRVPAAGELLRPQVVVRAAPSVAARAIAAVSEFRSDYRKHIVHAREARRDDRGRIWYRIMLVGRPNGRSGWIQAAHAELRPTRAEVVISRSRKELRLLVGGRERLKTTVAVGKAGAPTPVGYFYITSRFVPHNSFLGVFALELSAYSPTLTDWPGGGVVGIHGTSRPDLLGQAVSHGCVRVSNAAARVLQRYAPVGTAVRILP
jgi:lipoprotein-anchoring transpeptidase ErfK/SrfK